MRARTDGGIAGIANCALIPASAAARPGARRLDPIQVVGLECLPLRAQFTAQAGEVEHALEQDRWAFSSFEDGSIDAIERQPPLDDRQSFEQLPACGSRVLVVHALMVSRRLSQCFGETAHVPQGADWVVSDR